MTVSASAADVTDADQHALLKNDALVSELMGGGHLGSILLSICMQLKGSSCSTLTTL